MLLHTHTHCSLSWQQQQVVRVTQQTQQPVMLFIPLFCLDCVDRACMHLSSSSKERPGGTAGGVVVVVWRRRTHYMCVLQGCICVNTSLSKSSCLSCEKGASLTPSVPMRCHLQLVVHTALPGITELQGGCCCGHTAAAVLSALSIVAARPCVQGCM